MRDSWKRSLANLPAVLVVLAALVLIALVVGALLVSALGAGIALAIAGLIIHPLMAASMFAAHRELTALH